MGCTCTDTALCRLCASVESPAQWATVKVPAVRMESHGRRDEARHESELDNARRMLRREG